MTFDDLKLKKDDKGRSEAYYCLNDSSVQIDDSVIGSLKAKLEASGGGLIRICLHSGPDAALHEMIIVQRRGRDFKPHMHARKEESYHMLEGRLRIEFFDDTGKTSGSTLLGGPGTGLPMMLRVRAGVWHSTAAETEFAVIHESRPGPFDGDDSVQPDWA